MAIVYASATECVGSRDQPQTEASLNIPMSKTPDNPWQQLTASQQQNQAEAPLQPAANSRRPQTYDKAARLLRLYLTLKSSAPKSWTTGQLLRHLQDNFGFDITTRTIQRDLEELSAHFREIQFSGPQEGWSHPRIRQMEGMDVYTALSLKLIKKYLSVLVPVALYRALDGLSIQADQILDESQTETLQQASAWQDKVCMLAWGPGRVQPEISEAVQREVYEALNGGRKLDLEYASRNRPPRNHRVSPLGLVLYRDMLYLVGMIDGDKTPRYFSMRRIGSAAQTANSVAAAPERWNSLQAFAEQNPPIPDDYPDKVTVRLRFNEIAIRNLQEVPLRAPHTISQNPDGSFTLEAELKPNRELMTWVLYYGANVEVLAPPDFRERVRDELRAALSAYCK